jgi:PDZ domain-containing protein
VSRRSKTLLIGVLVLVVASVVARSVQVPLVALGPGPTFNTLGEVAGKQVVSVTGRPVYPTTGHLNMTTVSVTDGLNAVTAVRYWLKPDAEVVPRTAVYPAGASDAQVTQANSEMFADSENNAKVAALSYLHEPVKVVVTQLTPNAPAGQLLKVGDQLVIVNGQRVSSAPQVSQLLKSTRPGEQVPVTYQRGNGPPQNGTVTVGVRPGDQTGANPDGPQGFLGIFPVTEPVNPTQITVALDDVGGPSAGLMFSLGIVDKITPDDLTGGKFIAGTGTIDETGAVGGISGIPLKMIGARSEGATVFLVPGANCSEAKNSAPSGMQLVKVDTLTNAVNALQELKAGKPVPGC